MRVPAAALLLLASAPALAGDDVHADCKVVTGPDDVAQAEGELVVEGGRRLKSAIALRGGVVLRKGAEVEEAVALGGSLTVEPGARVGRNAIAVGGDVRVRAGASVGKDAISIGGKVKASPGTVSGNTLSLDLDVNGGGIAGAILAEVAASCRITEAGRR